MSDPQPEYVWAHQDDKPKRGRVWLIVVLVVVAVAIAAAAFWLFLRPGFPDAAETSSPTPSMSVSASPSATPTASPTPSPTSVPSSEPTAPPPAEPDLTAFRDRVRPWLGDAITGLGFLSNSDAAEAESIIDSLQGDEQRLSDLPVPSSIGAEWQENLAAYSDQLKTLRTAVTNGTDSNSAVEAARHSVESLQATAGL